MATDAQITVHIKGDDLHRGYTGPGRAEVAERFRCEDPSVGMALAFALGRVDVSWEWDEEAHGAKGHLRYLLHNGRRFTARRSLFHCDRAELEALAAVGVPFELEEGPEDYDPTDHWVFHPEIGPGLVSSDDGAPTLAGLVAEIDGLAAERVAFVGIGWVRDYAERKSAGQRFDELVSGINP